MRELAKRKSPRLKNFDYNRKGVYFLTICTQNRRCMLSHIVGTGVLDCPCIELTSFGKIADKMIKKLNTFYENMSIEHYVIMPNHIHFLLFVRESGQSGTPVPTKNETNSIVSRFISTFKRFCNKEYGENIWQDRFYDHIIRNREDYDEHVRYIYQNPIRWYYDELYSSENVSI